jgi:hypothetical protein
MRAVEPQRVGQRRPQMPIVPHADPQQIRCFVQYTCTAIEMALVSGAATQVRSIDSVPDWDYHVAQAPICALPSGSQHASTIPQHKVA